jgi:hypothetical protein
MPGNAGPRIAREMKTVRAMIGIFCRDRHGTRKGDLCPDCAALREYALDRLGKCRYGEMKTPCRDCPIHCYKPDMREAIRQVMRHAGPRMMWEHPWLSVCHLLDGIRSK